MPLGNGTKVVWLDVNNYAWHLAGPNAGAEGAILGPGPDGLLAPPHELLFDAGARQDGGTFRRSVVSKRDVDFNVSIGNDVGLSIRDMRHWQVVNDRWFRGWSRRTPGMLITWTPNRGWFRSSLYLAGPAKPVSGIDPFINLHESYDMVATAFDPFWAKNERMVSWKNTDGSNQGVLKMRNDSSEPAWARYTMNGPATHWYIQDVDPDAAEDDEPRMMQVPGFTAGNTARIDTHPQSRMARLYNSSGIYVQNLWAQFGGRRFLHAIEPWGTTEIVVQIEGGNLDSEIVGTLTPLNARFL